MQPAEGERGADLVVLAAPVRAAGDETEGDGAVDVGVINRFVAAVGHTGAQEKPEMRHELLLEIDPPAKLHRALAHTVDARRKFAGRESEAYHIVDLAHSPVVAIGEKLDRARLTEEFVAAFQFRDAHILAKDLRLYFEPVGYRRELKNAAARRPPVLLPLHRESVRVAPCVGGVVERPERVEGKVQKACRRVMRIDIVVEDVAYCEFAQRDDNSITIDSARYLVLERFEHLALRALIRIIDFAGAVQSDDLAQEVALKSHIGRGAADLGDGAIDVGGGADRIGEAVANIHLGIEIGRAALPKTQPEKEIGGRPGVRLAA